MAIQFDSTEDTSLYIGGNRPSMNTMEKINSATQEQTASQNRSALFFVAHAYTAKLVTMKDKYKLHKHEK